MTDDVLSYTFNICETVVGHKGFRTQLFELLLSLYRQVIDNTGSVDYRNVCIFSIILWTLEIFC